MCHSRRNNTKINNLHERCLRLIYSDKKSFYEELLKTDASVFIHHWNIQALATKMHKVKSRYTPKISSELFNQREIRPTISEDFLGLEYLWPQLTIMRVICGSKDMGYSTGII